jgi:hypothetical protein
VEITYSGSNERDPQRAAEKKNRECPEDGPWMPSIEYDARTQ